MNGTRTRDWPDPEVWHRPEMRAALAARDIAVVYRLLQRFGITQRRIAALTGQSQSEVSEIIGGRQVLSYDVLARIADGLGIPRGSLGMAYDKATAQIVGDGIGLSMDPESGRWVVQLPIAVADYGMARQLIKSITAVGMSLASPHDTDGRVSVERQWHMAAGATLAGALA